jgi:hypothetical protein
VKPTPDASTVQGVLADLVRSRIQAWTVRQRDVASDVGISEKHLSQMLTGRTQGTLAMWDRLLDALPEFQPQPQGDTAMDPNSGKLYTEAQMAELTDEQRKRLVYMEGKTEDIERISHAVADLNRADRRKANRAKGLRSNGEPK